MFSLRVCVSAALGAILVLVGPAAAGDGTSAGGPAPAFAPVNIDGLGATPGFIQPPLYPSISGDPSFDADPVLVPLPASAWAALSGLIGLAAVAAWRKHRLRQE